MWKAAFEKFEQIWFAKAIRPALYLVALLPKISDLYLFDVFRGNIERKYWPEISCWLRQCIFLLAIRTLRNSEKHGLLKLSRSINIVKGHLPQIFLSPFINTLSRFFLLFYSNWKNYQISTSNHMLGRAIWDKLPKCIFENFEIARVKRGQFQIFQKSRRLFIPKVAQNMRLLVNDTKPTLCI